MFYIFRDLSIEAMLLQRGGDCKGNPPLLPPIPSFSLYLVFLIPSPLIISCFLLSQSSGLIIDLKIEYLSYLGQIPYLDRQLTYSLFICRDALTVGILRLFSQDSPRCVDEPYGSSFLDLYLIYLSQDSPRRCTYKPPAHLRQGLCPNRSRRSTEYNLWFDLPTLNSHNILFTVY